MEYRKNEIRAGVFILTAFIIAVVMLFAVSDLQGLFKKRKEYKVLFLSNEGLEKNANVRISGIRIGRVSDMRVVPELGGKVELTLGEGERSGKLVAELREITNEISRSPSQTGPL